MKRIRVMAFMEASTVTGPAKNWIDFAKLAKRGSTDLPGIDFRFATFHRPGQKEDFVTAVRQAGLEISVIPERHTMDFRILSAMRAALAEFSPDIVQSHMVKSHFLIKFLGIQKTYPWIAIHHGYTTTDAKMLAYNQLNRYSLRTAHRVVTVCQAFVHEMLNAGVQPDRLVVQHNTVLPFLHPSEVELTRLRTRLGIGSDTQVILCVGRQSREKGHADLIQAAAIIHREAPELDYRLVLVGDGPERTALQQLSTDLRIADRVTFAGFQADVAPYFAMADIFALPSHSEGSPNVLLEAMAAGVPVVATAVGGTPEIAVHGENALLVPKRNVADMARSILRLLQESDLRDRITQNALSVTQRYTPESHRRNIVNIFLKLLDNRKIPLSPPLKKGEV